MNFNQPKAAAGVSKDTRMDLLGCPFCGKPPKYDHRNSFHEIRCLQRGCVVAEVVEDSFQEAAKRWNTRTLPSSDQCVAREALATIAKAICCPDGCMKYKGNGIDGRCFVERDTFDKSNVGKSTALILAALAVPQAAVAGEATFGEDGYNPAYDEGITYAIRMLADLTDSKDCQMKDGSENHDQDVCDTIMDVLKCAGLYDDETGKFAALAVPQAAVAEETILEESGCLDGTIMQTVRLADGTEIVRPLKS